MVDRLVAGGEGVIYLMIDDPLIDDTPALHPPESDGAFHTQMSVWVRHKQYLGPKAEFEQPEWRNARWIGCWVGVRVSSIDDSPQHTTHLGLVDHPAHK